MSMVATHKLLFLLLDANNLNYYVENGVVKKSTIPAWLKYSPDNVKDITLQWATNTKYTSTIRTFSTALSFIEDGEMIINDRVINGAGTEEIMYLVILRSDPTKGLNYYGLEYKSRLDFSEYTGDIRKGISMNTLQDDVFALVSAKDNVVYSLQCNATNPKAIKILFDGTLLQDKLNYQGTDAIITHPKDISLLTYAYVVPLTFLNTEGDSSGIINNSPADQTYFAQSFIITYVNDVANKTNDILETERPITVNVKGQLSFDVSILNGAPFEVKVYKNTDTAPIAAARDPLASGNLVLGENTIPINFSIDLAAGEYIFVIFESININILSFPTAINWKDTDLGFLFSSEPVPTVNYGIRPFDALQDLVSQITLGRYTADSNFFRNNNRKCLVSGSSFRSFPDALVQITFQDFFKAYHVPYNLSIAVRNGVMWIEPVQDNYNANQELINLGAVAEAKLAPAKDMIYASAQVGYQKQTYNKRNGRYEFNCIHNYNFPIQTILNKLDLVSPLRADSFGGEFIRTGYPDLTSTDDKGDGDVWTVMVSDEVGQTSGAVDTAIAFTVETIILATPIIKTPGNGQVVYNAHPTITGIAQPFKQINVYVDGVQDGSTNSDANGKWSYITVAALQSVSLINNGVHVFTVNAQDDPSNITGFSKSLTLVVNTSIQSPFIITSPTNNDTIYTDLPIIAGLAPAGTVVTIKFNGSVLSTATANSSGIWSYQTIVPLGDINVLVNATAPGLPDAPFVIFAVNKLVSTPLITSISYGDIIYNNKPLIKGVALPLTTVSIYLDGGGGVITGGIAAPLGTTESDINGDWSFQVGTVIDPGGNVEDGIPEGLHIISTTATPVEVQIAVSGYKLMRGSNKGSVMDYDAIFLDDQYVPVNVDPSTLPPTLGQFLHPETLWNIEETTPLRCLLAHANTLGSFLFQQLLQSIVFNGAEVNPNLVTKKNNVIYNERADTLISALGFPLYYAFYLSFKTRVPFSFNDIMTAINNTGYVSLTIKDVPLYCLPMGSMQMKLATDEAQEWKLIVSTKTPFTDLLKIFSKGLSLNVGKNMINYSDYNPLHFVKYNFTPPAQYNSSDIYDDFNKNRFPRFLAQPDFAQPWQKSDPLHLQWITNNVGAFTINMYSVSTAKLTDTFSVTTVVTPLVSLPNVMKEARIDLSSYPADEYWFALMYSGSIIAIAEKINLQVSHLDTTLLEYDGSDDKIDYYLSTGILPKLRIPSQLFPWFPDSEVDIFEDEIGQNTVTRGIALKKRVWGIGSEKQVCPDWMVLKINSITTELSLWKIQGTQYTRDNDSKLDKEDNGPGFPSYLYSMEITQAVRENGFAFSTPDDTADASIVYALDQTAWGLQPGVINVTAPSN